MREILFRGKTPDGMWIFGDYIKGAEKTPELCVIKERTLLRHNYLCCSDTVGQYTGLKDKNGMKIFEGDIVKGVAYSTDFRGIVIWIAEIASFGVRYNKRTNPTMIENSSLFKALKIGMCNEHSAEIIGNVHDNPELVEVQ